MVIETLFIILLIILIFISIPMLLFLYIVAYIDFIKEIKSIIYYNSKEWKNKEKELEEFIEKTKKLY